MRAASYDSKIDAGSRRMISQRHLQLCAAHGWENCEIPVVLGHGSLRMVIQGNGKSLFLYNVAAGELKGKRSETAYSLAGCALRCILFCDLWS